MTTSKMARATAVIAYVDTAWPAARSQPRETGSLALWKNWCALVCSSSEP
jgi:hypothetical protein